MLSWTLIKKNFNTTKVLYLALLAVEVVFLCLVGWAVTTVDGPNPDSDGYMKVAQMMYFGTFGSIITGVAAVLIPIGMLTKEIDNTSLAITLVSDNSRSKIMVNKIMTMLLMQLVNLVLTSIFAIIISEALAPDNTMSKFVNANASLWVGATVLMFITFFVASISQKKSLVYGIGFGILVWSIILAMVGSMVSKASWLSYITVFAFSVQKYITESSPLIAIGYCVGPVIVAGLSVGSIYEFDRRDLWL